MTDLSNHLSLVLFHGWTYGVLLTLLLSTLIVGSLIWNTEIWLGDYPRDIREKYGKPRNLDTKLQKWFVGTLFLACIVAVIATAQVRLHYVLNTDVSFWVTFVNVFTISMVFNLFDWLILDWFIFVRMQPKFIVLPGTEGMDGYKNYFFHFKAFLIGVVGITVVALIVAVVETVWI